MTVTRHIRPLIVAALLAPVAVVGLAAPALAKKHKTTTTTSPASQLSALSQEVTAAKNKTFKATWTTSGSGGAGTVILEQLPPKSLFTTTGSGGGGEVLATGKATYFCSAAGGAKTCISAAGANPLASLVGLYTGSAFLSTIQGFEAEAAAKAGGVSIKFSNRRFAGLSAKCVSVSANGQSYKWCVSDSGILAYASGTGGGGGAFQLTGYSTHVSAGDFNLPSGATVQSIP